MNKMFLHLSRASSCLLLCWLALASCQNQTKPTEQLKEDDTSNEELAQWVSYKGAASVTKGKKIVLVSGDEEYRSEEALPQLARILSDHHGFDCTVLFAQDPEVPGLINPNYLENIPGLEKLEDADLMILFTRFRALPGEQMQYIDHYLMHGKPLLAIRTATHAFRFPDSTHTWRHYGNFYEGEKEAWKDGFGRFILGERWFSHHGHHKHQSTRGIAAPGAETHPVLSGIEDGQIWGSTDVYGVRLPLPGDSKPLVLGQVIDRAGAFDENDLFFGMRPTDEQVATESGRDKKYDPNKPMMPIIWTKSYQLPGGSEGRSLTSTIGASSDLLNEGVRRVLVNAAYWLMGEAVPAKANVDLVGAYNPSPYSFHNEEGYWQAKNLRVTDYVAK